MTGISAMDGDMLDANKLAEAYQTIRLARYKERDGQILGDFDEEMARKHVNMRAQSERDTQAAQRMREFFKSGDRAELDLFRVLRAVFDSSKDRDHNAFQLLDAITEYVSSRLPDEKPVVS